MNESPSDKREVFERLVVGANSAPDPNYLIENVEDLVRAGRLPFGVEIQEKETQMAFFVPPEGTQFGDAMKGQPSRGYTFFSPKGEERGRAKMYVLPLDVGRKLKERIRGILQTIPK
jgi:hypothetical protein